MSANPSACRICGLDERDHMTRWSKSVGWHQWTAPTGAQILRRMQDRRRARLNAVSAQYHANTGWAADHTVQLHYLRP